MIGMLKEVLKFGVFLFVSTNLVGYVSGQCQMDGVTNWVLPIQLTIRDVDRGEIFRGQTTNTLGITSASHSGELPNRGPYFTAELTDDSLFTLSLNDAFAEYEEYETSQSMSIAVVFSCGGSLAAQLIFLITITDTNNNAPQFVDPNALTFSVIPPLVPGYEITGCLGEILVKDIDLTNYEINFILEDNDYLEIIYDERGDEMKTFKAKLRTKTLIRSLAEPLSIQITAEDVDLTGDPRQTVVSTLTLQADDEFAIPSELKFNTAYYAATYFPSNNTFLNDNVINLSEGYDAAVTFQLVGEYANFFALSTNGNSVTIALNEDMPLDITNSNTILYVIIEALREYTSGDKAAFIVEVIQDELSRQVLFESQSYIGSIQDGILNMNEVIVSEGYNEGLTFSLKGDFSQYFRLNEGGSILSIEILDELPESIFENHFIILIIEAINNDNVEGFTVVTLELIKETFPSVEFSSPNYKGVVSSEGTLQMESTIQITNGFDEDIILTLTGDFNQNFVASLQPDGIITLELNNFNPPQNIEEQIVILTLRAQDSSGSVAYTTIVIEIDLPQLSQNLLKFESPFYLGRIESNQLNIETIVLSEGLTENTVFLLRGTHAESFSIINNQNDVIMTYNGNAPWLADNINVTILVLEAYDSNSLSAETAITLEIVSQEIEAPHFSQPYYTGMYSIQNGFVMNSGILLTEGFDESVTFELEGDSAEYFMVSNDGSTVVLSVRNEEEIQITANTKYLAFILVARKPSIREASATIIIDLEAETLNLSIIRFEKVNYVGKINGALLDLENVVIIEGYTEDIQLNLSGTYANNFELQQNGNSIELSLLSSISLGESELRFVSLVIEAAAEGSISAFAAINIDVGIDGEIDPPVFSNAYYSCIVEENGAVLVEETITIISGYDETVTFELSGDFSELFIVIQTDNTMNLAATNSSLINEIEANFIVMTLSALKPNSRSARTAVIVEFNNVSEETQSLQLDNAYYTGSYSEEDGLIMYSMIEITNGYDNTVIFSIFGDYAEYFDVVSEDSTATLVMLTPLPSTIMINNYYIVLTLAASKSGNVTAEAGVIINLEYERNNLIILSFAENSYIGKIENDNVTLGSIVLNGGYSEDVVFSIAGEYAQYFNLNADGNEVTITLNDYEIIRNDTFVVLVTEATRPNAIPARAVVTLENIKTGLEIPLAFDLPYYTGYYDLDSNVIVNSDIILTSGENVLVGLEGVYAEYFDVERTNDNIQLIVTNPIPPALLQGSHFIILSLYAEISDGPRTNATIVLSIAEEFEIPTVSFNSDAYVINIDSSTVGIVGIVTATASNGEPVTYAISNAPDYVLDRLSVSSTGEIFLSSPLQSGLFIIEISATAIFSGISSVMSINLRVNSVLVCDSGDLFVNPLIILNRDEEEPHENILTLFSDNCFYTLIENWPQNKEWAYINENGGVSLRVIDREDEDIAFMALSQIQIELTLECEDDNSLREQYNNIQIVDYTEVHNSSIRRVQTHRNSDVLGPYNYGDFQWTLTGAIDFNPRKSKVNVIINDINDNTPVFDGKDEEPVTIGYPIESLINTVIPKKLITLTATDADIGFNAYIKYWSEDDHIYVNPETGVVYVLRQIPDQHLITVYATDQFGEGNTGSLDISVRQLQEEHIAVIYVETESPDSEEQILLELNIYSAYKIELLRSFLAVVEDTTLLRNDGLTKLRLFVYGLFDSEPVLAEDLIEGIESVSHNWTLSVTVFELPNESQTIVYQARASGFFVSTIVLSVLLFGVIVVFLIWYLFKRTRARNYEEFDESTMSDTSSKVEPLEEHPKLEDLLQPRQLIAENERRREDNFLNILDSVPEEITEIPNDTRKNDSIIDVENINGLTSIHYNNKLKEEDDSDDDHFDIFGEKKVNSRKSVVTFNENVEKIEVEKYAAEMEEDEDVTVYRF